MKIAVLTGGGDVPGLNSAVKGLVKGATERGWEVLGLKNGWQGILEMDPDDKNSRSKWSLPLDSLNTRVIDRHGGTFLHSSRTNPSSVSEDKLPAFIRGDGSACVQNESGSWDATSHVLRNLQKLGVDVLVPIGGDDTLSYGERLYNEGFKVVGIPKTMDNDVHGTDYCLGFASCVSRTVEYIHNLRTSIGSHERMGVIEAMGRNAGFTALVPGFIADVDHVLISEVPYNLDRLSELMLEARERNPSNYAIVLVSEGATEIDGGTLEEGEADAYGHRKLGGVGKILGDALKKKTGVNLMYQHLGYLVRCGRPDPIDVMVTFNFAALALELIEKKQFGRLVRIKEGKFGHAPMSILSEGLKRVDVERMYDIKNYRPKITGIEGLPLYIG